MENEHGIDCNCMISFPINYIFTYYMQRHNIDLFDSSLYGTSSLLKIFEQALICIYKTKPDVNLCLIQISSEVYLQKCEPNWIEEQVINVFSILFQSTSYSMVWQQLKETFNIKFGYSLGLSILYHKFFRKSIVLNQKEGNYFAKLSPIYQFAAMCLTVMILHSNSANLNIKISEEWKIKKLEDEYYDHFGTQIPKPKTFDILDLKRVFEKLNFLFAVNGESSSNLQIRLKRVNFLQHINSHSIPRCNYCADKTLVQRESNQNFLYDMLLSSDNESDIDNNEKDSVYNLFHM